MEAGDRRQPIPQIAPPQHVFTYDEERVEHIISDEKLMQVASGGKDLSLEISIAGAGVAFGYFQNFWVAAGAVIFAEPVGHWTAAGALIFVTAATVTVVAAVYHKGRSRGLAELLDGIRSRKVGTMADRPYIEGEPFRADPTKPEPASTTG